MGRTLAFIAIGLVFFLILLFLFWDPWVGLLAIPVALTSLFIASRRMQPLQAGLLGTAVNFGLIFGLVFPFIAVNALQGDFDNTAHCDGFCMTNSQGFAFATFILLFLAVPTSLAGGVISFLASLVTPRQPRAA